MSLIVTLEAPPLVPRSGGPGPASQLLIAGAKGWEESRQATQVLRYVVLLLGGRGQDRFANSAVDAQQAAYSAVKVNAVSG